MSGRRLGGRDVARHDDLLLRHLLVNEDHLDDLAVEVARASERGAAVIRTLDAILPGDSVPYALPWSVPILLLWFASPGIAWWVSRGMEDRLNGQIFHAEKSHYHTYRYGEVARSLYKYENNGEFTVDELIKLIPASLMAGIANVAPAEEP